MYPIRQYSNRVLVFAVGQHHKITIFSLFYSYENGATNDIFYFIITSRQFLNLAIFSVTSRQCLCHSLSHLRITEIVNGRRLWSKSRNCYFMPIRYEQRSLLIYYLCHLFVVHLFQFFPFSFPRFMKLRHAQIGVEVELHDAKNAPQCISVSGHFF